MSSSMAAPSFLFEGDVLQIGFHGVGKAPYPEDIVPAAVLRAVAQHLHLDLRTEGVFWGDYCYFAGVTGEAFRFLDLLRLSGDSPASPLVERYGQMSQARMYEHALAAAGLVAKLYVKPQLPAEAVLRGQLVASLHDRKCPVIGIGVFGPPEPFLITGYAEDGEVLLGWSHFQADRKEDPDVSFEASGQFRLRNWYRRIDGVAVVTGPREPLAARQVYRGALERAVRELQTTAAAAGNGQAALGTAAMEKWAAYLEDDATFATRSDDQLGRAQSEHGSTAGDLAERRALAASFCELAERFLPEAADDLSMAGTAFQGAHDTVYEIWETVARTGPFDPDPAKFRQPAHRRTIAGLVRRLVEFDRRGLAFLERALAVVDGRTPGAPIAPDPVLDGTVVLAKAQLPAPAQVRWAPENIAMPNALGMLAAFLGESVHGLEGYHLWMGLSGAAFGMLWDGPERANTGLALEALGFEYELWMSKELGDQTGLACRHWGWDDNLRRRIFWNLRDRRLPVLLFGWGQWPDWYLVTRCERWWGFAGYGGSSGEGYRPNEPLDHPRNPLRKIGLFEGMRGARTWTLNVLGKRSRPKPPLEDLLRRAIQWGAQAMVRQRMQVLDGAGKEFVSIRPYQDWAAMMRTDALFPADDHEVLKQRRDWLEGHEVELAERRFYGSLFLRLAAARLDCPRLQQASERFANVNRLMEQVWAQLGGMHGAEAHLKLGGAGVRAAIAALLSEMEHEDQAAAELLAR